MAIAAVTWPFRVAAGLGRFLDLFARFKRGEGSLRGATDAGVSQSLDDARMKSLLLHGRIGDVVAQGPAGERTPSQVSPAWELVRRSSEGAIEVVARGVFAYDVTDDGTVLWTDGSRIRIQRPGAAAEDLVSDHLVHDVAWLA